MASSSAAMQSATSWSPTLPGKDCTKFSPKPSDPLHLWPVLATVFKLSYSNPPLPFAHKIDFNQNEAGLTANSQPPPWKSPVLDANRLACQLRQVRELENLEMTHLEHVSFDEGNTLMSLLVEFTNSSPFLTIPHASSHHLGGGGGLQV